MAIPPERRHTQIDFLANDGTRPPGQRDAPSGEVTTEPVAGPPPRSVVEALPVSRADSRPIATPALGNRDNLLIAQQEPTQSQSHRQGEVRATQRKRKFSAVADDPNAPEIRSKQTKQKDTVKRLHQPSLKIWKLSPWDKYQKYFKLDFDEQITVACDGRPESSCVAIRAFSERGAEAKIAALDELQGYHFVKCFDIYQHNARYFTVSEHMPVSLRQLIAMPQSLDDGQVAAILGQVSSSFN